MDHTDLAKRLGATTLFSHLPREQLIALLEQSPTRKAGAGSWVANANKAFKDHIVLLSGELQAKRRWIGEEGSKHEFSWRVDVRASGPGFSILSATGRQIEIQALADSDYLSIDSEQLDELLGWSQLDGNLQLARHLKVFQHLPLENVQQAFERMRERTVAAGESIVTQGEPGDSYYIILSGEADVWVTDPMSDETSRVTVLSDSDGFGEESLLLEGNRTATVTMTTPGRLLVLTKADFDELLKPQMVDVIAADKAHEMLKQGDAKLIDCRYDMEFEESRIPGAQHIPLDRLRREAVFWIDPDPTYIVYCRSGRRSSAAAFLLRERGIRAISLTGGIRDWPFEVDSSPL